MVNKMKTLYYFKHKTTGKRVSAYGYTPNNALLELGYNPLDFVLVSFERITGNEKQW